MEKVMHRKAAGPLAAGKLFALPAVFTALALSLGCAPSLLESEWPEPPRIVPPELSQASQLDEMGDLASLPLIRNTRILVQDSSQGRNPGNHDFNEFICIGQNASLSPQLVYTTSYDEPGYCAESYVTGVMMARFEGSGTLSRFWMTQLNGGARTEVIRFYVDDNPVPFLQVSSGDIFSGNQQGASFFSYPFGAERANFFAWYYPLTFNNKLVVTLDQLNSLPWYYYQVAVQLDDNPVDRTPAGAALPERETARQRLLQLPTTLTTGGQNLNLAAAGGSASLVMPAGPYTIEQFQLRYASSDHEKLKDVALQIHWDGETEAAIALPLLDLFTAEQRVPVAKSLLVNVETIGSDTVLGLSLPMPYQSSASISLTNNGVSSVSLAMNYAGSSGVPAGNWGHLRTNFADPAAPFNDVTTLLDVTGNGKLVGVCAQMMGLNFENIAWYLEGDELITIDGDPQRYTGTGNEDYFNSGFYFYDRNNSTPFAQYWLTNDSSGSGKAMDGAISACRWHLFNNEIEFRQSLKFEFELTPDFQPVAVDKFRTVVFYYL